MKCRDGFVSNSSSSSFIIMSKMTVGMLQTILAKKLQSHLPDREINNLVNIEEFMQLGRTLFSRAEWETLNEFDNEISDAELKEFQSLFHTKYADEDGSFGGKMEHTVMPEILQELVSEYKNDVKCIRISHH